jgi:hypothetical protein
MHPVLTWQRLELLDHQGQQDGKEAHRRAS